MWVSRSPNGPSARFFLTNLHTLEELSMLGNCLQGSRPILVFDKTFDSQPHYKLIKELFTQVFGTPRGHPNSKPFIDHVFSFFIQDNHIWFRNYQIAEKHSERAAAEQLVEIGPRFVLEPVKIFSGSFGGQTIFTNNQFVNPNHLRTVARKKAQVGKFSNKLLHYAEADQRRKDHQNQPTNPLDQVFDDEEEEEDNE